MKAQEESLPDIGIIGLGNIGGAVAQRLLTAGYHVNGLSLTGVEDFAAAGGHVCSDIEELSRKSGILIEALPNEEAFELVFANSARDIRHAEKPACIVNLATYPAAFKESKRRSLSKAGIIMIDGEVSGTPAMVRAGEAIIFLGGEKQDVNAVLPLLSAVAAQVHRTGAFGTAARLKVINNLLSAVHSAAAAEAMALACRSGIDPELAAKLLARGGGGSQMMIERAPRMARRNYTRPSGTLRAMSRYLPLVEDLARRGQLNMPLFTTAKSVYDDANRRGWADNDLAVLFELYMDRNTGTGQDIPLSPEFVEIAR